VRDTLVHFAKGELARSNINNLTRDVSARTCIESWLFGSKQFG